MAAYTTIDDPEAYFQTVTYTGNGTVIGSGGLAVTLGGETDLQPDMVWSKNVSITSSHNVWDDQRGSSGSYNRWYPDTSDAEDTGVSEGLSTFNSDGMTFGNSGQGNASGNTHFAFCWKESADAGFDMVLYTGNDTARTISHSLSAAPHFYIVKARSRVANGQVFHHKNSGSGATHVYYLATDHGEQDETMFNDTAPTSSVFSVSGASEVNDDGETYITYLWTAKQGFSKFGTYTGNGNADGTFVYTGFRPAMVIVKRKDSTGGFYMYNNKRAGYNGSSEYVQADTGSAGDTNAGNFGFDLLSNGFKLRGTYATVNNSGGNYVYMAWAEAPFVNSNGVPCNAR